MFCKQAHTQMQSISHKHGIWTPDSNVDSRERGGITSGKQVEDGRPGKASPSVAAFWPGCVLHEKRQCWPFSPGSGTQEELKKDL